VVLFLLFLQIPAVVQAALVKCSSLRSRLDSSSSSSSSS